jgi:hypothetical protein
MVRCAMAFFAFFFWKQICAPWPLLEISLRHLEGGAQLGDMEGQLSLGVTRTHQSINVEMFEKIVSGWLANLQVVDFAFHNTYTDIEHWFTQEGTCGVFILH